MKRLMMVILAAVFGFGLASGDVQWVYAQESVSAEFTLEEITVTAQKRESTLQKTAASVSTIEGDVLQQESKYRIDEILQGMAGVSLKGDDDATKGSEIIIRGATDNLRSMSTADTPTAVYVDGVIQSNLVQTRAGQYDMSRVEVLRGPQGTLYGYNALAGSVNLISNDPVLDEFEGQASVEVGNYSLIHAEGVVNAPLKETSALRAAFSTEERDGYVSNGADDSNVRSGRMKFLYTPNDNFRLVLSADYTELYGNGPGNILITGGIIAPEDRDDPWETEQALGRNSNDSTIYSFSANLNWDIGFASLTYQPSYSRTEQERYQEDDGNLLFNKDKTPLQSHELRLSSTDDSSVIWTAGLNYMKKNTYGTQTDPLFYTVLTTPYNKSESKGVFGQVTYPLKETVRLTGGLRYTADKKSGARIASGNKLSLSASFHPVTFKVGVEADVLSDALVYAQVASGYRSGVLYYHSTMGMKKCDPQELIAYQVGFKSRFLDNQLQINSELFYYDYSSYQLSWGDMSLVTPVLYIVNIKDVYNYGGELESIYFLTKNDRVDFSVAYLQTDLGTLPGDLAQYSHFPANQSPEWSLTLGYKHTWTLPNNGIITLGGDIYYETDSWAYWQQPDGSYQPSYHKSNLSLNYGSPSGAWTVQGYVRNIENYPVITYSRGEFMGEYSYSLSAPRTFGAMVSVRF